MDWEFNERFNLQDGSVLQIEVDTRPKDEVLEGYLVQIKIINIPELLSLTR